MFGTFGDIFSKMGGMFGKGGPAAGFGLGQLQMPQIPGQLPPTAPGAAGGFAGGGQVPPDAPMPNPQAEGFGIGQPLPGTFSSLLGQLPQQAQGQGTPMAGMLANPNMAKLMQMMQMRGLTRGSGGAGGAGVGGGMPQMPPIMAAGGGLPQMQAQQSRSPFLQSRMPQRQIMPRG